MRPMDTAFGLEISGLELDIACGLREAVFGLRAVLGSGCFWAQAPFLI